MKKNNLFQQAIVAIDIETTGLKFGYHEITEIGMIRLDEKFNIIPGEYFSTLIKISHPERYDISTQNLTGIYLDDLEIFGQDIYSARESAIQWIEKQTPTSVIPLGQFYDGFDRHFLKEFFNCDCNEYKNVFSNYFSRTSIDLKHAVKTYNNLIDFQFPEKQHMKFEKYRLSDICKKLNIKQRAKHRAIDDAKVTALAYREILKLIIDLHKNIDEINI